MLKNTPRPAFLAMVVVIAAASLAAAGGVALAGTAPAAPPAKSAPSPAGPAGHVRLAKQAKPPLKGRIVGIDPGHNGRNWTVPAYLSKQIWNGRQWEDCDTTGTQTNGKHPYTEALFNFQVASYLRADLIRDGAKVVMTRKNNHGHGPCVNTRSFIINKAHANVAVDIHADGAPTWGRGFAILEPVADRQNRKVIRSSARLGADIRRAMLHRTKMPVSNYDGVNGINHRDDLAGLNLTKVPKILIEVGNMKNRTDARMLTSPRFQRQVARALLAAIVRFLK